MASASDDPTITSSSRVSMAIMAGILTTAIAGTWTISQRMSSIESRLVSIETLLADVHSHWRITDMRRWAARLKEANPSLIVPEPYDR